LQPWNFSPSFLSVSAMQGPVGSFRLPKVVFCLFGIHFGLKQSYSYPPCRVSSSLLSPKHPTAIPQEASKTQAINPQSSACSEAVINHSNGEEAIQSSKQMLKEEDEDVDDDKEVNQAVLVCEHAMKASKNLPRKGEEASGKLCSELLRTFFDFSCLPG
jgi:hypothetical protein